MECLLVIFCFDMIWKKFKVCSRFDDNKFE